MWKSAIESGRTLGEAQEKAKKALNAPEGTYVRFDILKRPTKLLGRGEFQVVARYNDEIDIEKLGMTVDELNEMSMEDFDDMIELEVEYQRDLNSESEEVSSNDEIQNEEEYISDEADEDTQNIEEPVKNDYKQFLISFDNLEDVMYTPLAENKELENLAWEVLAEIQQLQIQLQENFNYKSETGLFGGEKERSYYDNDNNLIMKMNFSVGAIESIYIYTDEGTVSLDTKFPIGANGTDIRNAELITVHDSRKKTVFSEISEERSEQGSRIGVHTFRIVFRGEETTVRYNTYGVLIPDFCGISSILGLRENIKAQKWANELNSQFM